MVKRVEMQFRFRCYRTPNDGDIEWYSGFGD